MKQYIAHLESLTPYAQGRHHETPKLDRESEDAYAKRTVLNKLHTTLGQVMVPPMAFKLCLQSAAAYLGIKIPGRGSKTYFTFFKFSLLFNEPIGLGIAPEECRIEGIFTWADPSKKSGSRVTRYFPVIDHWKAHVPFTVIDDILTPAILQRHWEIAGMVIGIGVSRAESGYIWGRFKLLSLEAVPEE
jgi:hypothetical protein